MDTSSPSKRRVLGELNPNTSPLLSSHRITNIKSQQRPRGARITMSPQTPQKQLGSPFKLRASQTERDPEPAANHTPGNDDSLGDSDQEPACKRSRLDSDAEGDIDVSSHLRPYCFFFPTPLVPLADLSPRVPMQWVIWTTGSVRLRLTGPPCLITRLLTTHKPPI